MKILQKLTVILALTLFNSSLQAKTLYGGGLLGGVGYLSEDSAKDSIKKEGLLIELKGILSFDEGAFVHDLGFGWSKRDLSGSLGTKEVKITQESLLLDASTKYRIGKFLIGPGLKAYFGEDNSYSSLKGNSSTSLNLGLVGQYLIKDDKDQVRVEASLFKALEDSSFTGIGVGISWLFGKEKEKSSSKVHKENEEEPDFKVVIKSARVLFNSASYNVDSDLSKRLKKLSEFLSKENSNWRKVRISGHTDNVGSIEYNTDLAEKRARTIRNLLVEGGIDPSKVEVRSYHFSRPIDTNLTEDGRSRNRRTEIEFFGVQNREVLNKAIVDILTK